jgi:hypothetical protein
VNPLSRFIEYYDRLLRALENLTNAIRDAVRSQQEAARAIKDKEKAAEPRHNLGEESAGHQGGEAQLGSTVGGTPKDTQPNQEPSEGEYKRKHLFWARFSAIAQAAFSALLLFVSGAQWLVYHRQADIMEKQSKVANKQADISAAQGRDGRTAQRAWIEVTTEPAGPPEELKLTVGQPIKVGGHISNIGQTPAREVHGLYVLEQVAAGDEPVYGATPSTPGTQGESGTIFPKRNVTLEDAVVKLRNPNTGHIQPLLVSPKEVEDWNAGRIFFVLSGEIDYGDIFNVVHWTTFCLVFVAPGHGDAASKTEDCPSHNDTDNNQDPKI